MGHMTWLRPFQGRFVICRLGLAMFNPHIKFEISTIRPTCNEEMKGNAKCKNFRFEPPLAFGDLGATHRVQSSSLWLDGMESALSNSDYR